MAWDVVRIIPVVGETMISASNCVRCPRTLLLDGLVIYWGPAPKLLKLLS